MKLELPTAKHWDAVLELATIGVKSLADIAVIAEVAPAVADLRRQLTVLSQPPAIEPRDTTEQV